MNFGQTSLTSRVPAAATAFTISTAAIVGLAVPANASSFVDVADNQSFVTEIEWLAQTGVSTGWGAGKSREFRPSEAINRDAMAAFLYRLAGSPQYKAPNKSPFIDVDESSTFYKEISWLASKGISTGWKDSDGRAEFRPRSPINRDAMAAFLYRYADKPKFNPTGQTFADVSPQTPFYREIMWLVSRGITTGWDDGKTRTFKPLSSIKRDAMAAFLYRYKNPDKAPSIKEPSKGSHGTEAEAEVLRAVNVERKKAGCSPVKHDPKLMSVARERSNDFIKRNYFAHTTPDGVPFHKMVWGSGWKGSMVGENIAAGQRTPNDVMYSWMTSDGHRQNILKCEYNRLGVGVANGGEYGIYWTQLFGRAAS